CWLSAGGAPRYWMVMYPCVACLIAVVVQRFAEAAAGSALRVRWSAFLSIFGVLMAGAGLVALTSSWPGVRPSRLSQPFSYAVLYAVAAGGLAAAVLAWRRACGRLNAFVPV